MDDKDLNSPQSDFVFELPPEPKSNAPKIIIVLLLLCIAGAVFFLFGKNKISLGGFGKSFTTDPQKIQSWMAESAVPSISYPSGVGYIGAYRELFNEKKGRLFVAGPADMAAKLPKTSAEALNLAGLTQPLFFWLVSPDNSATDGLFTRVQQQVEALPKTKLIQDKMWAGKNETVVFRYETEGEGLIYERLLTKPSEMNIFLAASAKTQSPAAVEGLSQVLKVETKELSFLPPPPSADEMAKVIVSGSAEDRKKAVTNLLTLSDPHPEVVKILAEALPKAATEVKVDIIAGLQLLVRKNPEAVQPLIDALKDKNVLMETMGALKYLGPTAVNALPSLRKIAANKALPPAVRKEAARTIAAIQPIPTAKKVKTAPRKRKK